MQGMIHQILVFLHCIVGILTKESIKPSLLALRKVHLLLKLGILSCLLNGTNAFLFKTAVEGCVLEANTMKEIAAAKVDVEDCAG